MMRRSEVAPRGHVIDTMTWSPFSFSRQFFLGSRVATFPTTRPDDAVREKKSRPLACTTTLPTHASHTAPTPAHDTGNGCCCCCSVCSKRDGGRDLLTPSPHSPSTGIQRGRRCPLPDRAQRARDGWRNGRMCGRTEALLSADARFGRTWAQPGNIPTVNPSKRPRGIGRVGDPYQRRTKSRTLLALA